MKQGQNRILLFDEDYRTMRDLKEHLEENLGWQVELTADAGVPERLGRERFDLIALDLMIHPQSLDADDNVVDNVQFDGVPWKKAGLEFLRRLRAGAYQPELTQGTPADVPVIVLSSVANSTLESELKRELDIAEYVEKPFRLEAVVEKILKLLRE
jgi:CheY-like chemotaxis protein